MIIPSQHATDCRLFRRNAVGLLCATLLAAFLVAGCDEGRPEVKAEDRSDGWPGWTDVARGNLHTLAVAADGTLWAWGSNTNGQLGIGSIGGQQNAPVQVGTSHQWSRVAAGNGFSLAVRSDGSLWSWGGNAFGQLGLGDTTDRSVPMRVGTSSSWSKVAAGDSASYALRANGTLWAMGYGLSGELGLGDTTGRNIPTQLAGSWTDISAGAGFALGMKSDQTLWGWGGNSVGEIGQGTFGGNYLSPVALSAGGPWIAATAGGSHGAGLLSDHSLVVWGGNTNGQHGMGDTTARNVPTFVGMLAREVAAASGFTHVILLNGTLWGAGDNVSGALGNGTFASQTVFVQAGTASNWAKLVRGGFVSSSAAFRADNTLWMWGNNLDGQVGDGTGIDAPAPVFIR